MNIKYIAGSIISIPVLPVMYFQGKKIRAIVPKLPEAEGPEGECINKTASNNHITLLTIGESTIAGVGVKTHEEGFTGTLAKELSSLLETNVKWKVYARSGYTARRVSEKLIPEISETDVDLIVIGLGGNDAFTLNSPRQWRKHIGQLLVAIRKKFPESAIVFCNMPPIKEFPAFTRLIKFVIGNLVEILGDELHELIKDHENVFYVNDTITLAG
jgi:lysophospholipase L1-like esterase